MALKYNSKLKDLMSVAKDDGILIPAIDNYLLSQGFDEDRLHGMNSPSAISQCPLSQYFTRMKYPRDGADNPRSTRIFGNGTHVHIRLQDYLLKCGKLLMDEVPVYNKKYNIIGHTDGIVLLDSLSNKVGVLEIKSMNSRSFASLTDAKIEHKEQAHVYMFALEQMRKDLAKKKNKGSFYYKCYVESFIKKYAAMQDKFVKSGKRFTKEEKIKRSNDILRKTLTILGGVNYPIDTVIFLYECKDTQALKEFCVRWDYEIMNDILNRYEKLNEAVELQIPPPRPEEATSKSGMPCRYCNYQFQCYFR